MNSVFYFLSLSYTHARPLFFLYVSFAIFQFSIYFILFACVFLPNKTFVFVAGNNIWYNILPTVWPRVQQWFYAFSSQCSTCIHLNIDVLATVFVQQLWNTNLFAIDIYCSDIRLELFYWLTLLSHMTLAFYVSNFVTFPIFQLNV